MENIKFRIATIQDLLAIQQAGKTLFDFDVKKNRAIEFLHDSRHHLMLAFDKNKLVGMVSAVHYVHPDKDPSLFINEVGVVTNYQNRGIGRKLVRLMCEHGKKVGCIEAWVLTDKSNERAKKTYSAAGGILEDANVVLYEFK